jgi:hypothetical protein
MDGTAFLIMIVNGINTRGLNRHVGLIVTYLAVNWLVRRADGLSTALQPHCNIDCNLDNNCGFSAEHAMVDNAIFTPSYIVYYYALIANVEQRQRPRTYLWRR